MKSESQMLKDLKKCMEMRYDGLIAFKLGYKSSLTPMSWVTRNRIPEWRRADLEVILDEILKNNKKQEKIA